MCCREYTQKQTLYNLFKMTDIYDKNRMKCRTNIQQLNTLFEMGKELEGKVNDLYDAIQEINDNIELLME